MFSTLHELCDPTEVGETLAELVTWRGTSNTPYEYWALPIDAKFKAVDGNYIFARRNSKGGWVAIYIGQGDLSTRADVRLHRKGSYILEKGATHVHVRGNPSLMERMTDWADVLDSHPEALEPIGCNGNAMTTTEDLYR